MGHRRGCLGRRWRRGSRAFGQDGERNFEYTLRFDLIVPPTNAWSNRPLSLGANDLEISTSGATASSALGPLQGASEAGSVDRRYELTLRLDAGSDGYNAEEEVVCARMRFALTRLQWAWTREIVPSSGGSPPKVNLASLERHGEGVLQARLAPGVRYVTRGYACLEQGDDALASVDPFEGTTADAGAVPGWVCHDWYGAWGTLHGAGATYVQTALEPPLQPVNAAVVSLDANSLLLQYAAPACDRLTHCRLSSGARPRPHIRQRNGRGGHNRSAARRHVDDNVTLLRRASAVGHACQTPPHSVAMHLTDRVALRSMLSRPLAKPTLATPWWLP